MSGTDSTQPAAWRRSPTRVQYQPPDVLGARSTRCAALTQRVHSRLETCDCTSRPPPPRSSLPTTGACLQVADRSRRVCSVPVKRDVLHLRRSACSRVMRCVPGPKAAASSWLMSVARSVGQRCECEEEKVRGRASCFVRVRVCVRGIVLRVTVASSSVASWSPSWLRACCAHIHTHAHTHQH
eukprot:1853757-Rhodomonas_salina.1